MIVNLVIKIYMKIRNDLNSKLTFKHKLHTIRIKFMTTIIVIIKKKYGTSTSILVLQMKKSKDSLRSFEA